MLLNGLLRISHSLKTHRPICKEKCLIRIKHIYIDYFNLSRIDVKVIKTYLNNNTVADAILDRVTHSSHRVEIEGESMRKVKSNITTDYTNLD